MNSSPRGAFSLLEILVVLAIAALMAALVMGGFTSFRGSQRRATCQANLSQVYRACRLYSNDYGTFPLTFPSPLDAKTSGGLGLLWARRGGPTTGSGMIASDDYVSYLKSSTPLHCPADVKIQGSDVALSGGTVNLNFLSYQKVDTDINPNQNSYKPVRTPNFGGLSPDPDYVRQLIHLRPDGGYVDVPVPSNTVVTWCPFHRGVGGRPDNVLFYDGTVKRMEITQDTNCLTGRGAGAPALAGWRRVSDCSSANSKGEGAALATN